MLGGAGFAAVAIVGVASVADAAPWNSAPSVASWSRPATPTHPVIPTRAVSPAAVPASGGFYVYCMDMPKNGTGYYCTRVGSVPGGVTPPPATTPPRTTSPAPTPVPAPQRLGEGTPDPTPESMPTTAPPATTLPATGLTRIANDTDRSAD